MKQLVVKELMCGGLEKRSMDPRLSARILLSCVTLYMSYFLEHLSKAGLCVISFLDGLSCDASRLRAYFRLHSI